MGVGSCAGVNPALAAGGDNIWGNGVLPTGDVMIVGGEVSEVDRRHGYLLEEQEQVVRTIV
jgi:hypothetical protein